jgi:hypothetical protein
VLQDAEYAFGNFGCWICWICWISSICLTESKSNWSEPAEPKTDPSLLTSPIFTSGMAWLRFQDVPRFRKETRGLRAKCFPTRIKCWSRRQTLALGMLLQKSKWWSHARKSPYAQLENHMDVEGRVSWVVYQNILKISETSTKAMFSEPFGTLSWACNSYSS